LLIQLVTNLNSFIVLCTEITKLHCFWSWQLDVIKSDSR